MTVKYHYNIDYNSGYDIVYMDEGDKKMKIKKTETETKQKGANMYQVEDNKFESKNEALWFAKSLIALGNSVKVKVEKLEVVYKGFSTSYTIADWDVITEGSLA